MERFFRKHVRDYTQKNISITIGGKANLDGFCEDDSRYVFVEAKCHEPYIVKKNVVSECYVNTLM